MVALDYHANPNAQPISAADAVFGYHFSPHTDIGATGERAAECLFRKLRGDILSVCVLVKPGVMVPSIFSATGLEPLRSIVLESIAASADSSTYTDISIFPGFSYADVLNCGFSVVVVADSDTAAALKLAESFSSQIVAQREALNHRELRGRFPTGMCRLTCLSLVGKACLGEAYSLLEHLIRLPASKRCRVGLDLPAKR